MYFSRTIFRAIPKVSIILTTESAGFEMQGERLDDGLTKAERGRGRAWERERQGERETRERVGVGGVRLELGQRWGAGIW